MWHRCVAHLNVHAGGPNNNYTLEQLVNIQDLFSTALCNPGKKGKEAKVRTACC